MNGNGKVVLNMFIVRDTRISSIYLMTQFKYKPHYRLQHEILAPKSLKVCRRFIEKNRICT